MLGSSFSIFLRNLFNIAPSEIIPLEAMRIGLRSDTFHLYLNKL